MAEQGNDRDIAIAGERTPRNPADNPNRNEFTLTSGSVQEASTVGRLARESLPMGTGHIISNLPQDPWKVRCGLGRMILHRYRHSGLAKNRGRELDRLVAIRCRDLTLD